jgi:hypothetical protein
MNNMVFYQRELSSALDEPEEPIATASPDWYLDPNPNPNQEAKRSAALGRVKQGQGNLFLNLRRLLHSAFSMGLRP